MYELIMLVFKILLEEFCVMLLIYIHDCIIYSCIEYFYESVFINVLGVHV